MSRDVNVPHRCSLNTVQLRDWEKCLSRMLGPQSASRVRMRCLHPTSDLTEPGQLTLHITLTTKAPSSSTRGSYLQWE
jgi:hypothetical protein